MVDEAALLQMPCDVFMPCALGQTLTIDLCNYGPWRAICGAANNQLVDPEGATILARRGVAWAPDFVVNAGAVIEGVATVLGPGEGARERVAAQVEAQIDAIADRVASILERSRC